MHDEEMIKEVKRNEVEEELRRQVDYLMREELDLLKIVRLCNVHMKGRKEKENRIERQDNEDLQIYKHLERGEDWGSIQRERERHTGRHTNNQKTIKSKVKKERKRERKKERKF